MLPGDRFQLAKVIPAASQTVVAINTGSMRVVQLLVPAGQTIPKYEAQGEIVIHCLEGECSVSAHGEVYELSNGELLYLLTSEPFSIQAKIDMSLLITMAQRGGSNDDLIGS